MSIAEEIADFDLRRGLDEALKDGALVDALGAPRTGEAGDFKVADKSGEKISLRGGQFDMVVDHSPATALRFGAVLREEIGVG